MLRIYLCDDNKLLLEKYSRLIESKLTDMKRNAIIRTFSSGERLVFSLGEDPDQVDIIFLDILMKGMNGIAAAHELREMGCHAEIIFLTSSEEHVFDSFDVAPMHYLLKDSVNDQKVCAVLKKAVEATDVKNTDVFCFRTGSEIHRIPFSDIKYFEVRNRIIHIFTSRGEKQFYSTLDNIEKNLPEKSFTRVHRSFVVNLQFLEKIAKDAVTLTGGIKIPLGSTYIKHLKTRFATFLSTSLGMN